jgi:hypothetical protein
MTGTGVTGVITQVIVVTTGIIVAMTGVTMTGVTGGGTVPTTSAACPKA